MYLIFDTETNGLPINGQAKMSDTYNWPRVAQLAWQMYDANFNLVKEASNLIRPDGWIIPKAENFMKAGLSKSEAIKKAQFFIDNGHSTERCQEEGIPLQEALVDFIVACRNSVYLIAHNIEFDYNTLGCEMIRYGMTSKVEGKPPLIRICTMRQSTGFCRLVKPGKSGYKPPKLEELYKRLFNKIIENAHDALGDVKTAAACFFELVRRGIIRL